MSTIVITHLHKVIKYPDRDGVCKLCQCHKKGIVFFDILIYGQKVLEKVIYAITCLDCYKEPDVKTKLQTLYEIKYLL